MNGQEHRGLGGLHIDRLADGSSGGIDNGEPAQRIRFLDFPVDRFFGSLASLGWRDGAHDLIAPDASMDQIGVAAMRAGRRDGDRRYEE